MTEKEQGIKLLEIIATTAYPIVSAYEYEFLKQEEVVRESMDGATVYFILQRPLTFFDNLMPGEGELTFDIWDGANPPLKCHVDIAAFDVAPGRRATRKCRKSSRLRHRSARSQRDHPSKSRS